eukprot:UC4_evm2s1054
MLPLFYRSFPVVQEVTEKNKDGEKVTEMKEVHYVEIQDLLASFVDASILDCKMGFRTFQESQVKSKKLRLDLLKKMIKIDKDEPTEEEKEHGITKLRYMQFRENRSTSASLGFRIDGMKLYGQESKNDFQSVNDPIEVSRILFKDFLPDDPGDAEQIADLFD